MNADFTAILKELYGFQNPQFCNKIERGYLGDNFVIKDGQERYVVKAYNRNRSRDRVAEIHKSIAFFSQNGDPVILPLAHSLNSSFFEYENRFFAIFPFVVGKQFDGLTSLDAVRDMGVILAHLHRIGKGCGSMVVNKKLKQWSKEKFIEEAQRILQHINELPKKSDFDRNCEEYLRLKLALARENDLQFDELKIEADHIIHGDFHDHNVFFDEEDHCMYVFDFERIMPGSRGCDIAITLFLSCFESDIKPVHLQWAQTFLSAYAQEYPISHAVFEQGMEWYFWGEIVHNLWIEKEHYHHNNNRCDELLPDRKKRLLWLQSRRMELVDLLKPSLAKT